jgi:hypothetical protein
MEFQGVGRSYCSWVVVARTAAPARDSAGRVGDQGRNSGGYYLCEESNFGGLCEEY